MELREARRERGLTQEALAHTANISLTTVRKLEAGNAIDPAFRPVMTICRVLGRSWEEIDEFRTLVEERGAV